MVPAVGVAVADPVVDPFGTFISVTSVNESGLTDMTTAFPSESFACTMKEVGATRMSV